MSRLADAFWRSRLPGRIPAPLLCRLMALNVVRKLLLRGRQTERRRAYVAQSFAACVETFREPLLAAGWHRVRGGPPRPLRFHLNDDLPVWLRSPGSDVATALEIFGDRVYDHETTRGRRFPVVVDVGGNVGLFARWIASRADRVVTLEPEPENFALLRRNVAGLRHVEPIAAALAATSRDLRLRLFRCGANTFLLPSSYSEFDIVQPSDRRALMTDRVLDVPALGVEELFAKARLDQVDLLKVDCEGSEYEIFDRLAETGVISRVRAVVVEYHGVRDRPEWSGESLKGLLARCGFSVIDVPHKLHTGLGLLYADRA